MFQSWIHLVGSRFYCRNMWRCSRWNKYGTFHALLCVLHAVNLRNKILTVLFVLGIWHRLGGSDQNRITCHRHPLLCVLRATAVTGGFVFTVWRCFRTRYYCRVSNRAMAFGGRSLLGLYLSRRYFLAGTRKSTRYGDACCIFGLGPRLRFRLCCCGNHLLGRTTTGTSAWSWLDS